ncbi:MAG: PAS domain S-box protein [Candidatus Thorarchaeota archaeon]
MAIQINEHIEELMDAIPDLVVIFDSNGKVINVSQKVLDLYNLKDKNYFIGKNISDFVVSEQLNELQKNFKELRTKGYAEKHEYKLLKGDGNFFYAELSAKVIESKSEGERLFITIVRDITTQRILLEELNNSRKMFQIVLDNIPQYIFWKDRESKFLGCNTNFSRVAGVGEPKNIVGKMDFDLPWKSEEAESYYEIERLVMESGKPEFHVIEPQLQADGKQAWLDVNRIPLHDSQGKVIGLLGTYEDITERKIAEEKLKESEEKFRTITEQSFMGIIIIQDGNIKYINEVLPSIMGYNHQEVLKWSSEDFFKLLHPEDLPIAMKRFQRMQMGSMGTQGSYLYRLFTKSREIKWIDLNSKVIQYQGKNAILVTVADMTAKREAEKLILEENKRLLELNKLRKDLITRISHELRTPLTSIYGVSQILLSESIIPTLSEEIRAYIEIFHRGTLRLKELVENLLDASRLDTQKLELRRERINLSKLTAGCIEELIYLINSRDLSIHLDQPDVIYYNVDKNRLSQAIINLLSNAIKNTPLGGKICVKIVESNEFIDIVVKDTGVGITHEEKQKLFQKFGKIERYGQNLDVDIEGAGLGLYISKQIVELHKGQILVESDGRNKGSTFIIRLFK